MKSGFLQEPAAGVCLGFEVILESPEKGALMSKDTGSQPCHHSLVGREGARGAAEPKQQKSWCSACSPSLASAAGQDLCLGVWEVPGALLPWQTLHR